MADQPRILASFVQGTLEVIDGMGDDLGQRVRETLKPETLDDIENAWAASWLPIGHDLELTSAFFRLAGTRRGCEAMQKNMADTFRKPTLRSIIDGAIRVLGLSPGKLLRWGPRIWPLLFRDMGEMRVETDGSQAKLWLEGLPPEVGSSRDYLLGTAAAISAVFDLAGVAGSCDLGEYSGGTARFDLRWENA